jgi:hypothetical protein
MVRSEPDSATHNRKKFCAKTGLQDRGTDFVLCDILILFLGIAKMGFRVSIEHESLW